MELSPKQQTTELIKNHQNILLVTHANPDGDALGSLLALGGVLEKLDKKVELVCATPVPTVFSFLPAAQTIKERFTGSKELIVSVNTATVKIDKLGYRNDPGGSKINIVITPAKGTFRKEDVEITAGSYKYDLVIVLDASDLDRLGPLHEDNPSLFYETPVVNIDHHASNDYFGKVNWVDLTATSTSEILVALIESLGGQNGKNLLDEDIATCLLTGIITDTDSFQNQNTTPKSLTVAAQLVAAGARQQEIIQRIYKTKPLSTLKLWGIALMNLQVRQGKDKRFVWSSLSANDYDKAGAALGEEQGLIDELIKSAPDVDFAVLLSQRDEDTVHASLRAIAKDVDTAAIAEQFGGGGHPAAAAFEHDIDESFDHTAAEIVDQLAQ